MATYVVGDVQGCYEPLVRLLDSVAFDPEHDRLWAVGDLIARGPASLDVVRFLRSLGDAFFTVLGNHDLNFLAVARGRRDARKRDRLQPLLEAKERDAIVEWFGSFPLAAFRDDTLLVHAGVPPSWSLEQTLSRSAEVEAWLRSEEVDRFLDGMYGNDPDHYAEDQPPLVRARTITNALTRMRFCDGNDRLDLDAKGGADRAPAGMRPWFEHAHRKLKDTSVAFGHWAMLYGNAEVPNVYALDTACVWGGTLTLLRLEDKRRFSAACDPPQPR